MSEFKAILKELSKKVKEKGVSDNTIKSFLDAKFMNKSDSILEVLDRGITKYIYKPSNRIVWTALGTEREYIIYPKLFCSCIDFYKEVVIKKSRKFCKHLIAQIISESLNSYNETELEDNEFKIRLEELFE
jgi:predicted nucleic acid-binding Zn finger protein